mmetsp:Transcript_30615/g.57059  ORF Transcript_30615/g.57059 Transcript_30615/m.57059 type:complete len:922 (+) Transcript_30615:69-2834(+)
MSAFDDNDDRPTEDIPGLSYHQSMRIPAAPAVTPAAVVKKPSEEPKQPSDFLFGKCLGEGAYARVVHAKLKKNDNQFAIKIMEKMHIKKENKVKYVMMEKNILSKMQHPFIVRLYYTFQDAGYLYMAMDLAHGGELRSLIASEHRKHNAALALAMEKDGSGVQKKVDEEDEMFRGFGDQQSGPESYKACDVHTAKFYVAEIIEAVEYLHDKDIIHRDLKPENVLITASGHLKLVDFGTCKDLRQTDLNGQEFVGTAEYMAPEVVDSENSGPAADLWSLGVVLFHMVTGHTPFKAPSPYLSFLRIKRAFLRLPTLLPHAEEINEVLTALLTRDPAQRLCNAADDKPYDPNETDDFSYAKLRGMKLFLGVNTLAGDSVTTTGTAGESSEVSTPAVRVPTLQEMAVRAVANASLIAAEQIAANGGVRNASLPKWVQEFKLCASVDMPPSPRRLAVTDRASIMQYLRNKTELHSAAVYRLFFSSVIDSRNLRTDIVEREYIGYSRSNQGQWSHGFSGVHFANPQFGQAAMSAGEAPSCDKEHARLRTAISAINKMRPKFVVVNGNFIASTSVDSTAPESTDSYSVLNKEFRRCMARVSETIPVLYVPGENDVGSSPTVQSLERYHAQYGADYYGFWFGGVRLLVLNTSLLMNPEHAPEAAARQHTWLVEELEQCKLCAMQVVVFGYHSFFEDEDEENSDQDTTSRKMPQAVRDFWLPRFRNLKVKFVFSANSTEGREVRAFAKSVVLKKKKRKTQRVEEVDENGVSLGEVTLEEDEEAKRARRKALDTKQRGSELKPSEIIAQAAMLEGKDDDLSTDSSDSSSDSSDDEGEGEGGDKGDDEPIFEKKTEKEVFPDGEYEDSSPFSPDLKYSGPTVISTAPMGGNGVQSGEVEAGVLRVLAFEDEETASQTLFPLDNLPAKLAEYA